MTVDATCLHDIDIQLSQNSVPYFTYNVYKNNITQTCEDGGYYDNMKES